MTLELISPDTDVLDPALRVYLLGSVDFDPALRLQHALAYQVAGDRRAAALVLCEHPPLITVGRDGSPADVRCGPDELRARRWRVRWVNRGGGSLLHLPGQLAVYPVVPLDSYRLGLEGYLRRLHDVLVAVLDDFGVQGHTRPDTPGVWAGDRMIAGVGVAVRDWVSYFGAVLNVDPDLTAFRLVRTGPGEGPMTSLARERRGGVRPSLVRERLLEHFNASFGFASSDLFFGHPLLSRPAALAGR